LKSEFLSGAADRQQKIEAAIRKLLSRGWSRAEILDSFYNIGIDQKDTEHALAIIESEGLEAISNRQRRLRTHEQRQITKSNWKGQFDEKHHPEHEAEAEGSII
jgi:hypothetical protein